MQEMSEKPAASRANSNNDGATGYENDKDHRILTCIATCKVLSLGEVSITKAQTKVPFMHPINPQDLNTLSVFYELFTKLPPCVNTLICEAQKQAEPGFEQCKVNFYGVDIVTTDDLAPDIDNLEKSCYQYEANIDDDNAGNHRDDDDQQILAHATQHKILPPSDI